MSRATVQRRNPTLPLDEVRRRFHTILLDPDPAAIEIAQDLLLENGATLSQVSEVASPRQACPTCGDTEDVEDMGGGVMECRSCVRSFEADEVRQGVFVVRGVGENFDGVEWSVRSSRVRPLVNAGRVATFESELEIHGVRGWPWRAFPVPSFSTMEEAVAEAMRYTWAAVRVLHGAPPRDLERAIRDAWHAVATRSDATPSPIANPGDLEPNPPWVTSALAQSYEVMEAKVPPKWLPKLTDLRAQRGRLVGRMREYGCGAYGCVLPTLDPDVVLKVTTDTTEAQFAKELANQLVAPICVAYRMVMSLPTKHNKRPIFLLWREAAEDVGDLDHDEEALELVGVQHVAAQKVFSAFHSPDVAWDTLRPLLARWERATAAMQAHHDLAGLAAGLLTIWQQQHIFFGDLHTGNLGRVKRNGKLTWVVTDPGHVAVIAHGALPSPA